MRKDTVTEIQKIFRQRDIINRARQTVWLFRDLFGVNKGIVGIMAEDGASYTLSENGNRNSENIKSGNARKILLTFELKNEIISKISNYINSFSNGGFFCGISYTGRRSPLII